MRNINWGLIAFIVGSLAAWTVIVLFVVWLVGCSPNHPYIPAL